MGEVEIKNFLFGAGIGLTVSIVAWVIRFVFERQAKKDDAEAVEIRSLREEVGIVKRDLKTVWRNIDEIKTSQKEHLKESAGRQEELRDKLHRIEIKLGGL